MYDPPAYLWALIIAGTSAIAVATCVALYGGAIRADLGRRRAALLAGAAAVLLGGWLAASAAIAGHGWYDTRLSQVPWMPVAAAGFLAVLLALSRIPVAARALAAPGMPSRLLSPHSFRVAGVFFLLYLAFGHLPALFALPRRPGRHRRRHRHAAGRAQARAGHRPPRRPVVQRVRHHRSGRGRDPRRPHRIPTAQRHALRPPISELPLALVPTVTVPLLLAVHVTSIITLAKAPRPAPSAAGPLIPGVASA